MEICDEIVFHVTFIPSLMVMSMVNNRESEGIQKQYI